MKEEETQKKEKKLGKLLLKGIILLFIVFALSCSIFGLINFTQVKKNKDPFFTFHENVYETEDRVVTVYNYLLYKIVKVEEDTKTSITLKLFFLKD